MMWRENGTTFETCEKCGRGNVLAHECETRPAYPHDWVTMVYDCPRCHHHGRMTYRTDGKEWSQNPLT